VIPARAIARPWQRLPAPLLNGASVGLGLAVITTVVASIGGMPAAVAASSGAAAASVADTVSSPQAKPGQMAPAVLGSVLVAALVALTHAHLWALTLCVLAVSFSSVMWTSWGKRGGPQTFAMVLSLVFQMSAFVSHPMDGEAAWQHLGWVAVGAVGLAAWAHLTAWALAPRYRALALVDSLAALASLMRTQADWTATLDPASAPTHTALLPLARQQAAIADVFQSARDLLYSQPLASASPRTQGQISALVHIVNLRDVVLACQLDLDSLPPGTHAQPGLPPLTESLRPPAHRPGKRPGGGPCATLGGNGPPAAETKPSPNESPSFARFGCVLPAAGYSGSGKNSLRSPGVSCAHIKSRPAQYV